MPSCIQEINTPRSLEDMIARCHLRGAISETKAAVVEMLDKVNAAYQQGTLDFEEYLSVSDALLEAIHEVGSAKAF